MNISAQLPPGSFHFNSGDPVLYQPGVFALSGPASKYSDGNWIFSEVTFQFKWSAWTKQEIDLSGLTQVKEMTLAPLGVAVSTPPIWSLGGTASAGQLTVYDVTFVSTIPYNEQDKGTPETHNWLPNSQSVGFNESPVLSGFQGGPTDTGHILFGQMTLRSSDSTQPRNIFQVIEQSNWGSMQLIGTDKLYIYRVILLSSSDNEQSSSILFQIPPQNLVMQVGEVDVDSLSHSMAMFRNVGNTSRSERRGAAPI